MLAAEPLIPPPHMRVPLLAGAGKAIALRSRGAGRLLRPPPRHRYGNAQSSRRAHRLSAFGQVRLGHSRGHKRGDFSRSCRASVPRSGANERIKIDARRACSSRSICGRAQWRNRGILGFCPETGTGSVVPARAKAFFYQQPGRAENSPDRHCQTGESTNMAKSVNKVIL